MSLFSRYCEERFGVQTIEEPWGFISFNAAPPMLCIQDFYILPEARGSGRGKELLEQAGEVGKLKECTHYWTQVCTADRGVNATLQMALHAGFQVIKADADRIILTKAI